MAQETEIGRMLIRLVGDTKDYQRSLQQAEQDTKRSADNISAMKPKVLGVPGVSSTAGGLGKAQPVDLGPSQKPGDSPEKQRRALDELNVTASNTRRSLMLLSASGVIQPEAGHSVFMLIHGLSSVKDMVGGVIGTLSGLRGALTATGIGAVVVSLGVAVAMLSKWSEEASKARESANQAFSSIVTGVRTVQQAMSDVNVQVLTEGLKEVVDVMKPGFSWQGFKNFLKDLVGIDAVGAKLDDVVQRSQNAQRNLRMLTAPLSDLRREITATAANEFEFLPGGRTREVERQIQAIIRMRQVIRDLAGERGVQASRDVAQGLEEEADRYVMGEREARRYAEAQKMVRESGIELTAHNIGQALNRLAPSHARQRVAEMTIDINKMRIELRGMADEADRAGLSDVNARIVAMAQAYREANPAVGSLADAMERLRPQLQQARDEINRRNMNEFNKGIREQIQGFGLSSERARLFQMAMDGASEATIMAAEANVKHLESLKALQAPLETIQGARSGSTEALHRIAEYQRALEFTTTTGDIRQRLLASQQSGMASPAGPGMLAGGTAAASAQVGAITQAQLAAMTLPTPQGPGGGPTFATSAGFGAGNPQASSLADVRAGIDRTNVLLGDIKTLLTPAATAGQSPPVPTTPGIGL